MSSLAPGPSGYEGYATAALRVTLGLCFVKFAYEKLFPERVERIAFFEKLGLRPARAYWGFITFTELLAGVALTAGFFTQAAAVVTGILMMIATFIKLRKPSALPYNTSEFYVVLVVVSFAIVLTGAGAWAVDAR